jgi:LPXTG-motif cell wall-anchored protein
MMRKYSKLLTFLIAFSMILSMHVSFAVPEYIDYEGNDSYTYKVNSNKSSTWYFDEDGNNVDGPTDYWVKFTVSGDELSFETNNLSLDLVSIKGGPMYRVYTNLGSSESGLTAPLNKSGNEPYEPYGISHYSFELDEIIPPPPPEKADVRVEKSIDDMEDEESLAGFKFVLQQNDETKYGPVTTNSSGYALFEDVEPGTYDVVELLTNDQKEIYTPEKDVTVTVEEDEEGLVRIGFENSKVPEDEELGSLIVHKRIMKENGSIVGALDGGKFTVRLTGPNDYDEEKTINGPDENGEHVVFDDLPFGTYTLSETKIDHEGKTYGDPIFATSGNKNYTVLNDFDGLVYKDTVTIEIESTGQEVIWLINVLEEAPPPPPELGEIEISKALVDEEGEEITDDNTNFTFKIEIKVANDDEGFDWVVIDESPISLKGGEFEKLTDLPLGEYRITEINIPDGYMLHEDTDNPQTTTLETDGDVDEVMFTNVREDDTPPPPELGEIEVTKVVQNRFGNGISSSTRFYFELQMFNDDEEWEVKEEKSILGNGTVTFDDLKDGLYRVREVRINSDFRLFSDNNLEVEVEDASSEEVEFINRLRPPQDDEDDDRPPRPRPEPEEEEEEIITEVLPETTVVPEPEPEIVVEEEPEVEVVEEVTPLATLPRTGASDPAVFAGFGAAFMTLGLFLKKKRF